MGTKEEGIVLGWLRGLEQGTPKNQRPLGWNEKGGREERGLILGGSGMGIRGAGADLRPLCPEMEQLLETRECVSLVFLLIDLILIFFS